MWLKHNKQGPALFLILWALFSSEFVLAGGRGAGCNITDRFNAGLFRTASGVFDLTTRRDSASLLTFHDEGLSLDVSAGAGARVNVVPYSFLGGDQCRSNGGVGVEWGGLPEGEILKFSFDQVVLFKGFSLTNFDPDSSVIFSAEGVEKISTWGGLSLASPIALDSFTLTGLTGNPLVKALGVTAVPVPASAWLFGSALVGLAGLKRKK